MCTFIMWRIMIMACRYIFARFTTQRSAQELDQRMTDREDPSEGSRSRWAQTMTTTTSPSRSAREISPIAGLSRRARSYHCASRSLMPSLSFSIKLVSFARRVTGKTRMCACVRWIERGRAHRELLWALVGLTLHTNYSRSFCRKILIFDLIKTVKTKEKREKS